MRAVFFTLIAILVIGAGLPAQSGPPGGRIVPHAQGDSAIAERYLQWAEQAIKAGQWTQARNALERAVDYADVSSDISYLLALARFNTNESCGSVLQAVEKAIRTGLWSRYSEAEARLLEARQFIAMRRYSAALESLAIFQPAAVETADSAMLRLAALKGLVVGTVTYSAEFPRLLSEFRRKMTEAMNRYPRDARALRLFFDYANYAYTNGRTPNNDDIAILGLALERLPFLLPKDPELAWIAAPFISDVEKARQSIADYRGNSSKPNPASLAAALNLGLLDDIDAVEELFAREPAAAFVVDKDLLVNVWKLLRSEEGRERMARNLMNFSGTITEDKDRDGYQESCSVYKQGVLEEFHYDDDQDRIEDITIIFNSGVPQWARIPASSAVVFWESYPSVQRTVLKNALYLPAPGGFKFSPIGGFEELCASDTTAGLKYPRLYPFVDFEITGRMLASCAVSIQQPSVEFAGGVEYVYLENSIPVNAEVKLDNKIVSFTGFENGRPVIQWLDLDLDGRMETVRRFRKDIFAGRAAMSWDELQGKLPSGSLSQGGTDLRQLLESSESDWNGDGKFESGELYREDGSVVNKWNLTN
ncbi:MAG: hypothetical protein LBU85_01790 [Treponema sp.]|jgi:hypothetical protein|nr:hypothetical protein [Treponema sp.]